MTSEFDKLEATLPRGSYLDPHGYAREAASIFHKEWFCAGRREGLESRGEYRLVNVTGESILIVCDEGGKLNAFYNVCRHRGAQLISSDDGKQISGDFQAGIRCPYHSWNYQLNGDLHSTPHVNIDKSCMGLHQVEVDEWGGFVFLRLIEGDKNLLDALGDVPGHLQRYPLADLRIGRRIEYSVAANWKVILENFNECYHCAGVHPELCKVVPAFRQGGGMDLPWEEGIPHREGANTFTFSGTTNREPFPGLNENEKTKHVGDLVYPNTMLSLSMDHAVATVLWPRSADHTDIISDFLFHPDEMSKADFDPMDAVDFWDMVNKQDWTICESVQRGMNSRMFESGFYAPMEDWSLDIRDYVRERMLDK